jgi:hypothetical protein
MAEPIPAPGEDGGRAGTGFPAWAAASNAGRALAEADTRPVVVTPITASMARASLAHPP